MRLGLEDTTARLVVEHGWVVAAFAAAAPAGSVAAVVFVLIPLLAAQLAAVTPKPIKQRVGEVALPRIAAAVAYTDGGGGQAEFCDFRGGVSALETLARRASSTARWPRSSRRFWTKGSTFARSARCSGAGRSDRTGGAS